MEEIRYFFKLIQTFTIVIPMSLGTWFVDALGCLVTVLSLRMTLVLVFNIVIPHLMFLFKFCRECSIPW